MDEDLKHSVELMNNIIIGAKVTFDGEWFTVNSITPCEYQRISRWPGNDDYICAYCIGNIGLDDKEPTCYCCDNTIEFDDVIPCEFLIEDDMEIL